jgi:hypothetical protein
MHAPNPFNPRIPAHPDGFIGRDAELREFSSCLNSTIQNSPMSMAIVGNRGIGKSSFLAKCEQVGKEHECIVIRFSAIEGSFESIEDICKYLLIQIQNEIIKRSKLELLKRDAAGLFDKFQFKISYEQFGLEIERKEKHSILQSLFREKLSDIWKNLRNSSSAIILMIDEAEMIEAIPGALMFLREVFSRLGEERCSYMLVLSGKLAFPEQMTEKFSPLARFFHPVPLYNFSKHEAAFLVDTKLKSTNIKIEDQSLLDRLYEESEGHPYVLVAMAYVLYENLPEKDGTIRLKHYDAIKPKITAYLNVDYFGIMYKKLRPTGKLILKQIAEAGGEMPFSHIIKSVKKSKGAISPVILELVEQGSLIRLERGRYKIFHNLYKEYILISE